MIELESHLCGIKAGYYFWQKIFGAMADPVLKLPTSLSIKKLWPQVRGDPIIVFPTG